MTKKRIATLATCLTLVGAVAVGGTLALLTSETKGLTNTFTVGTGYDDEGTDFILKEHVVTQNDTDGGYIVDNDADPAWVYGDENGTLGNQYSQVVEDTDLYKDPTFEISANCTVEKSWIVARIANVNVLKEKGISVSEVAEDNGWIVLDSLNSADYDEMPSKTVTVNDYTQDEDGVVYLVTSTAISKGDATAPVFETLHADRGVSADEDTLSIKGVAIQKLDNDDDTLDLATLKEVLDSLPNGFGA